MTFKPDPTRTRPVLAIDPDAAFAAALAQEVTYGRGLDVRKVLDAAAGYAAQTMSGALGALAVRLSAEGPLRNEGWTAEALPEPSPTALTFRVSSSAEAGDFVITIEFRRDLAEGVRSAVSALNARVEAERRARKVSRTDMVVAEVTGIPAFDTEAARDLAAIFADPASYAPIGEGTVVRHLLICRGGVPVLDQKPALRTVGTRRYMPNRPGFPQEPDPALVILSAFLRRTGLDARVAEANAEVGAFPWSTSGVAHFTALEEAAYAAVCAADGLFDETVSRRVRDFAEALPRVEMSVIA